MAFKPAVRQAIPLLIGLAGGTGSGKTFSAMELARGLAGGHRFAVIDTENGRALHYADTFDFDHDEIRAPFRPAKYADKIAEADGAGYPVIVVDSGSHEWYGDGGCLDWHDQLEGGDSKKKLTAWIEPKRDHKKMVTRLLQVRAHVIICFRAEPKVEAVRGENGRLEIVPKASVTGLDGWIPIAEKNLPYEMTASFLLMAERPGVPKPIKLPEQLRSYVPLDRPVTADVGAALAVWAAGDEEVAGFASSTEADALAGELLDICDEKGIRANAESAIARNRQAHSADLAKHVEWLRAQIENAKQPAEAA